MPKMTVRVPDAWHIALKQAALDRRTTATQIVLDAVSKYLGEATKVANTVKFEDVTWHNNVDQTDHAGVRVAWQDLTDFFGHEFTCEPEEDQALTAALIASGAPSWVEGAHGDIDEIGWVLYNPMAQAVEEV